MSNKRGESFEERHHAKPKYYVQGLAYIRNGLLHPGSGRHGAAAFSKSAASAYPYAAID
jgi:hypothetical protein